MKKYFFPLIIVGGIAYFFFNAQLKKENSSPPYHLPPPITTSGWDTLIRIVYFLDVSKSALQNGVELVSSEVFTPYFITLDRNIELNFGCIDSMSARKLIHLTLTAQNFYKPPLPDVSKASITEKRKFKEQYAASLKKYKVDSTYYFSHRDERIQKFRKEVDSLVSGYRKKLSRQTDLVTAVAVADKAFNLSRSDSAKNFLILNSDGIDSHKRTIKKINNRVDVILVNADALSHTSIDSILTISFQSSDEAIRYSLTHIQKSNNHGNLN